ncbi:uncharacterized protein ASCRUDRAFT_154716 [Ascoidea rubescens DSM 1968]|uniref:Uncharacterized protein n=1 Tax=Ascoidea rubescens DSM 1968 TaxID=1344418 RepID=A0A1D2VGB6_9ASCO|nr:hypothetical protein ASCRUDRAFT_154716 [Ascoidea rubescens DSM 1968]ODV60517.1 hypothetical protein ASCRUDRAFT_154716 [Ascoidea rubescens DSM 1968]
MAKSCPATLCAMKLKFRFLFVLRSAAGQAHTCRNTLHQTCNRICCCIWLLLCFFKCRLDAWWANVRLSFAAIALCDFSVFFCPTFANPSEQFLKQFSKQFSEQYEIAALISSFASFFSCSNLRIFIV